MWHVSITTTLNLVPVRSTLACNSSPKSLLRKVTFLKNITFLSHQTEAVKIKRKRLLEAESPGSKSQFHHFLLVYGT